jgi:hypothetical protein
MVCPTRDDSEQIHPRRGTEPAPLAGRGGEGSDVERGGYLTGRLFRRLLDEQVALDAQLMMAAAVHAANVAQSGSLPRSGEALVKEHTVGCLRIARRGHTLDEDVELLMFGWGWPQRAVSQ